MFKIVHEDHRHLMASTPGLPISSVGTRAEEPSTLRVVVADSAPLVRAVASGDIFNIMIDTMIVTALRVGEKLTNTELTVTYALMQCTCDGAWHDKWHVDPQRCVHQIAIIDCNCVAAIAKK
jgi:hypothetical protein